MIALQGGRSLTFAGPPLVMAILNVTPDSFSDGGHHFDTATAVEAALRMESEGADVIDIGGESTRPGSLPVEADIELARVLPVIEEIRRRSAIPISVDTMKASVAEAALDAGADIVNDVSAGRFDREMLSSVARRGAALILMHMRGEPRTMQDDIHFDDVVREVSAELRLWRDTAAGAGVDATKIFVDPGIGFGKTFDQNLALLANVDSFAELGPVVIGASRKGFLGQLTGRPAGLQRVSASLAAASAARLGGAAMVRVHDVAETVDFLKVFETIVNAG